ncbi:hypothetical protein [Dactylosporangium sp. NPDC006015]|uniref:DUF7919 family protein n=1 Tax=Dactylosporangium sp. NPDC006015 TaxID=3154576 RepID=UPI0033BCA24F
MEYPDLSPYEYYEFPLPMRNVGWLGPSFTPRPPAPDVDPRPLRAASRARSNVMLGWHDCPWCPGTTAPHDGNGEYHYYAHDGEVYAAPVMLLHYVEVHGYRPPEQFLQALRVPGELPWDDRADDLPELVRWGFDLQRTIDGANP